ncbi:beta-mannosidase-like [Ctenocephalides felis]|uniref:beta-mannosidase-like n=1 Tax=Ctenocephalides felis TaxID=7515 RepID=UPI000E6E26DA|nr:beta-mannosidase-like [Ctenocephalides felis]
MRKSTGVFCIEVETDAVSPFVWLEVKGIKGTFSKNGYLQVDPVEIVDFQAADNMTADDIAKKLRVYHC